MSGFVSGGTNDAPSERDDAWLKAQQEIEARRLAKIDAGKQEGGKSLYETLQANKDAKQEAFEESMRLKNQFRTLDEDEVEFLDSVLESTRAKEAEAQRETNEQLDAFRARKEEAEMASRQAANVSEPDQAETWTTTTSSRKRKKLTDHVRPFRKRPSFPAKDGTELIDPKPPEVVGQANRPSAPDASTTIRDEHSGDRKPQNEAVALKPLVGLAGYSSSEDEDDA